MALRAPPQRHAAGGRRARPRRSARRTAARASRVPRAITRGDGDRDRGERFVEAAPKEANAKASRRDENNDRAQPRRPEDGAGARRVRGAARRPARDLDWNLPRGRVRLSPLRRERRGTNVDGRRRRRRGRDPPKRRKRKRKRKPKRRTRSAGVDYPFVSSATCRRASSRGTARGRARSRAPRRARGDHLRVLRRARAAPEPGRRAAGAGAARGRGGCRRARGAGAAAAAARKASENKVRKYVKHRSPATASSAARR